MKCCDQKYSGLHVYFSVCANCIGKFAIHSWRVCSATMLRVTQSSFLQFAKNVKHTEHTETHMNLTAASVTVSTITNTTERQTQIHKQNTTNHATCMNEWSVFFLGLRLYALCCCVRYTYPIRLRLSAWAWMKLSTHQHQHHQRRRVYMAVTVCVYGDTPPMPLAALRAYAVLTSMCNARDCVSVCMVSRCLACILCMKVKHVMPERNNTVSNPSLPSRRRRPCVLLSGHTVSSSVICELVAQTDCYFSRRSGLGCFYALRGLVIRMRNIYVIHNTR